jgi:hypothetical protein
VLLGPSDIAMQLGASRHFSVAAFDPQWTVLPLPQQLPAEPASVPAARRGPERAAHGQPGRGCAMAEARSELVAGSPLEPGILSRAPQSSPREPWDWDWCHDGY